MIFKLEYTRLTKNGKEIKKSKKWRAVSLIETSNDKVKVFAISTAIEEFKKDILEENNLK